MARETRKRGMFNNQIKVLGVKSAEGIQLTPPPKKWIVFLIGHRWAVLY